MGVGVQMDAMHANAMELCLKQLSFLTETFFYLYNKHKGN